MSDRNYSTQEMNDAGFSFSISEFFRLQPFTVPRILSAAVWDEMPPRRRMRMAIRLGNDRSLAAIHHVLTEIESEIGDTPSGRNVSLEDRLDAVSSHISNRHDRNPGTRWTREQVEAREKDHLDMLARICRRLGL